MAMFKKPDPAPTDNGGTEKKSKWQGVIDHMTAAERHMSEAMNLIAMINFDLQKGADFIAHYRDSLIRTVEDAGGVVEQPGIEQAIQDYLPKALRDRGEKIEKSDPQ